MEELTWQTRYSSKNGINVLCSAPSTSILRNSTDVSLLLLTRSPQKRFRKNEDAHPCQSIMFFQVQYILWPKIFKNGWRSGKEGTFDTTHPFSYKYNFASNYAPFSTMSSLSKQIRLTKSTVYPFQAGDFLRTLRCYRLCYKKAFL